MVCQPLDWTISCQPGQSPIKLSDLSGGYLISDQRRDIYDTYRLLSTDEDEIDDISISIPRGDNHIDDLCDVMNKLQGQAFQINSDLLKYILTHEDILVNEGLLVPRFLASMNIKDLYNILSEFHMMNKVIQKLYSFNELLHTLLHTIQRSRYEQFILKFASSVKDWLTVKSSFRD